MAKHVNKGGGGLGAAALVFVLMLAFALLWVLVSTGIVRL